MPPLSHLTSCTPTKSNSLLIHSPLSMWPWPLQVPHIPCAESDILFPLVMLYQGISPSLCLCEMTHNMVNSYSKELLAPRPTSKLVDQFLLTVCNCLFNTFTATLYIGNHSSIHNLRTYQAMVTGYVLWAQNFIFKKDTDQLLVFTNQIPLPLMVSSPLLPSCPPKMIF